MIKNLEKILTKTSVEIWICPFCGNVNLYIDGEIAREGLLCNLCNSSWRERALLCTFLQEIGRDVTFLNNFELDFSVNALGIGDSFRVQAKLASKFKYVNTFLDAYPLLDIEVANDGNVTFDVITCSDVLEHVFNLEKALSGIFSLLKDQTSVAIVSFPTHDFKENVENYPNIVSFEEQDKGILWVDSNGKTFIDENPFFHGGNARTLEIRKISKQAFLTLSEKFGLVAEYRHFSSLEYGLPELAENPGFFILKKISS